MPCFFPQSLVAFYGIGYTEPTMRAENRSVRKMAQSYVSMVKQVQRRGPYYLAGQSFGGLVAYEMANILTEQSENVAFVAMIDTFPWYLPNRTGAARLEMLFSGTKLDKLMDGLFEVGMCIFNRPVTVSIENPPIRLRNVIIYSVLPNSPFLGLIFKNAN